MSQDPRVFFAAERTLLAWVRSGVAMMAMGFVVAKFGLFLKLFLAGEKSNTNFTQPQMLYGMDVSNILGISLVIIGVVITLCAQYNHDYYIHTLPPNDVPALPIRGLSSLMTYSIALVGILLAIYLIVI
jgi:putative membrane protein